MVDLETPDQRNTFYKTSLAHLVQANHRAFRHLRGSISATYWLMMVLLTAMFVAGLVLIFSGTNDAISGELDQDSLIALGAGGGDLVLLGLARPIERIRQIKSDRAQLFVILSDYHVQTTMAMLWYKGDQPKTMLQAADRIRDLTLETVHMIETYMHSGAAGTAVDRAALGRLEEQNRRVVTAVANSLGKGNADDLLDSLGSTLRRSQRGVLPV